MKYLINLLIVLVFCFSTNGFSHLCNDVFQQAKDNLAVKVDIRDGQLRVNQTASFRVYLLNTMDRSIQNIQLSIDSDEFEAVVKPSPDWNLFPTLSSVVVSPTAKKEYFIVELKRKPGIKQGKYKIGLRLSDGTDKERVFKTVDISEAMAVMEVPVVSNAINIDGNVSASEWGQSLLCTALHEYDRKWLTNEMFSPSEIQWQYIEMIEAVQQTRFRFSHDNENLYCLVDFIKKDNHYSSDTAIIYFAGNEGSEPDYLIINQVNSTVQSSKGLENVYYKINKEKAELQIPLNSLNLKTGGSIFVNLTRKQYTRNKTIFSSYWRGNQFSEKNPLVYANFVLK